MSLVYRLAQISIRLAGWLLGWKVIGRENVPAGPALIASNHLSNYDPPMLGSVLSMRVFYFAKVELFRNRAIGWFLRGVHAFPVNRGKADRHAWKQSQDILKRGDQLIFFPEGTRSKDGEVQSGQPGMARLAFATGAPVVPAAICGSNRIKDVLFRRAKLRVGFAQPIYLSDYDSPEDDKARYDKLTDDVMAAIRRLKTEIEAT
ncbi:MAG: 1-acyl-sn-glycerol-3-phosphate acyltransferase [bacterium]|nr:1-acyl-sn-glycerol-3-phosphate acyltransferase [bacterium]